MKTIQNNFFSRKTETVAKELIGKVIFSKYKNIWLKAQIIETEAYMKTEKGSHASLGFTEKKKALFMPPGTIYMYYARGKDSFNISTDSPGDAVLIKSGVPYLGDKEKDKKMLQIMKKLNPINSKERETMKLCSGQTLIAKSLNIKLADWNQKNFDENKLFIADIGYKPKKTIQTQRLGIPKGRDEHLPLRYIDEMYVKYCTKKPILFSS
ncbi:MAG: DNA-3-methyladenine glycosylase [Patescibacteria group bacterium]